MNTQLIEVNGEIVEFPADMTDEQIADVIRGAPNAQAPDASMVESAAAGVGQGGTFGFGDEIYGALANLAEPVSNSVGSLWFDLMNPEYKGAFGKVRDEQGDLSYAQHRDHARGVNQNAQDANPITYGAAEIGTGLASGLAGGVKAAANQTLRQAVPRLMGVGALEGGTAGAGFSEGETAGEVLADTAIGAGTGGVLGAALPGAAKVAGNLVAKAGSSGNRAARRVKADLDDAGLTPSQAQELLDANPNMMLADLGESLQQRLGAVANSPGATPQRARELLQGRNEGQLARFGDQFKRAFGDTPVSEAADAAVARTQTAAGPLYEAAYETAIPPGAQTSLRKLLERPAGKAALRKAQTLAKNEGTDIELDGPLNMRTMDYVQRALRINAEAVGRKSPGDARPIKGIHKDVLGVLDSVSPDFRQARKIAADEFANKDALELGAKVFTETTPNLRRTLSEMSDSEREHFRVGVFEKVADMMASKQSTADITKVFSSPKRDEALRLAFDNDDLYSQFKRSLSDEQTMFETMRKAITGSPTASRQAFGQGDVPTTMTQFVGQNLQKGANLLMGTPNQRANDAVGQMLMGRNPVRQLQQMSAPAPLGRATGALAAPASLDPQRTLDLLTGG